MLFSYEYFMYKHYIMALIQKSKPATYLATNISGPIFPMI